MAGAWQRRVGAAVAVLAVAACSGDRDLPSGREILSAASRAMGDVRTARFALEVEGPLTGLAVRGAEGAITRDGEASGTVSLEQSGDLVLYEVVIAEGTFYVKGPTGGFQALPAIAAQGLYDPTRLLDPFEGLAGLLATARDPRTVGVEEVDGTEAYRVRAGIGTGLLDELMPLAPGQDQVDADLWVAVEESHLLRIEVSVQAEGEDEPTTLRLTFSDFNRPTDIEPPET